MTPPVPPPLYWFTRTRQNPGHHTYVWNAGGAMIDLLQPYEGGPWELRYYEAPGNKWVHVGGQDGVSSYSKAIRALHAEIYYVTMNVGKGKEPW